MNNKYRLLVGCIFFTVLTGAQEIAFASTDKVFSLAGDSWPGYAPFWVAQKEHLFKGIKFVFIKSETRDPLLLSGRVDAANLSMNQIVNNYKKGYKTPIVIPMDYSYGADAIVGDKSLPSVKSIVGHKVVLNTDSYSELLLLGALKRAGLTLGDVKQVNMKGSSVPAALISGNAKVGVTWQPNVSVALSKDSELHVIFSSRDVPGLISDNIVFKEGFARKHPDVTRNIIKGFIAGEKYIKQHPASAYKIMGEYMGVSPSVAKTIYTGVHNVTLNQMNKMFSDSGNMSYSRSISDVLDVMKYQKEVPVNYNPNWKDFIDTKYVDEVIKSAH